MREVELTYEKTTPTPIFNSIPISEWLFIFL